MYAVSIPAYVQGCNAMQRILAKAEDYCQERKIDPAVLLGQRLFADMLPLTRQIQIMSDHARRGAARLAGTEHLAMADTESSLPELRERLAATVRHLETFRPSDMAEAAGRTINFKTGQRELSLSGAQFLAQYSMPNFYFHMTTAYDILRHCGLQIGKADFMGA